MPDESFLNIFLKTRRVLRKIFFPTEPAYVLTSGRKDLLTKDIQIKPD
jgi:hypothetical protein